MNIPFLNIPGNIYDDIKQFIKSKAKVPSKKVIKATTTLNGL